MKGILLSKWEKLLQDPEIKLKLDPWLNDPNSITFKIEREDFRRLDLRPVRMIPQYCQERLPGILKDFKLELFRTGSGECVLTKTGEEREIGSLFPKIPQNFSSYKGPPFRPIYSDSILINSELVNEETGIFLAIRTGIISAFMVEIIGENHVFSHSGRINTNVQGEIYISSEKINISSTQMECDAILESDKVIIAIEAKKDIEKSFSIHQIVFPMLLLRNLYPNKDIFGLYLQFEHDPTWIFQLHLLEVPLRNGCLDITNYSFYASKEYKIFFGRKSSQKSS